MLRYIFFINVSTVVLVGSLSVCIAVAAALLGFNLATAPQYQEMMVGLLRLAGLYALVTAAGGLGAWGIHRHKQWHWLGQLLFVLSLALAWQTSIQMLTNA